ncbi:MAG: hypothetical protein KDB26_09105 [Microthrixaceae bacterium]|nr:hypothetical protein [Microthrixaceae bacterium]
MNKAITVRLDAADHSRLTRRAKEMQVAPGTLARLLLHAGLDVDGSENDHAEGPHGEMGHHDAPIAAVDRERAVAALNRLVERSGSGPERDVVKLIGESRNELGQSQ